MNKQNKDTHSDWSLTFIFLALFAAFLFFGYIGREWAMALCLPLLLILLFIILPNDIKELHWPGGKLIREVRAAKEVLTEIKDLSLYTAKLILTSIQGTGRIGGVTDKTKNEIFFETKRLLEKISATPKEIENAQEYFCTMTQFDYASALLGGSQLPNAVIGCYGSVDLHQEWQDLRKNRENPASPDEIESFLSKWDYLTPERKTRLDNYRYYITTKEHKDLNDFCDRHNWENL